MSWIDDLSKIMSGKAMVPACGEGRDAVFLAILGFDVTAIDFSSAGLEKTRKLAERHGVKVETVEADLMEMNFPKDAYDVIVSNFVHMPSAYRPLYHANLKVALKPGGFLFLEGFRRDQIRFQKQHQSGGPPDVDMLFYPPDIQNDFEGLTEFAFWSGVETLSEGQYHTGPAALLRAVYKKQENSNG